VCVALLAAGLFLWLGWYSLVAGTSRLVSDYGVRAHAAEAVELAARLTPSDPEGQFALAELLTDAGDLAGAARAYEQAIALRPRDYVLWLELGKARDRLGDTEGALAAFREAVRLAPFYAQPRWQSGQALLRAGRSEEAVVELRRACESDPALYPNFVQTLWHAGGRDPQALARDARPQTPEQTLVVTKFLIKAGAAPDAARLLRASGADIPEDARRSLVADLIAAEDFADAYQVWSEGRAATAGSFVDGGFEAGARADEEGFGWHFARETQGIRFSLDADSPREGSRSLKVEYTGASDPSTPAVSQLVTVEQGARYRLTFAARTRELVTGGPPFVQVSSASKTGEVLATLAPLTPALNDWREFATEFQVPQGASAIRVALKRQPCATSPCPAFGILWLDAFELKRL
jgi:tetratricopeptide (TPR) repeat protein